MTNIAASVAVTGVQQTRVEQRKTQLGSTRWRGAFSFSAVQAALLTHWARDVITGTLELAPPAAVRLRSMPRVVAVGHGPQVVRWALPSCKVTDCTVSHPISTPSNKPLPLE